MRIGRITAALALLAASPVLAVLAGFILVGQGRPVLFRQARSGQHGVPFTLVKFRSMRDARDEAGHLLPDAERTTTIGAFLRRSRLDELPGLWNVARGEMNWIGPRPLLPETIHDLGERGRRRCEVRPGLTGYSQISGNTLLDLDDKIALDLWYVEHRSPRLDASILARTIGVMVLGERLRHHANSAIAAGGPSASDRANS
ncbi:sugar transferase [Qipengyuania sp. XHP0207]|uniref:sugar transferase n=1 Tax=Qipengyuania sp. XHP0207 TaxID=3038078 RepID=UPI00241D2515|nr:sugar transferase [Qipengyuania sp. XHP0207]MDG5747710.1 sugar transferase [Qipengyuania sp. XHP0207]